MYNFTITDIDEDHHIYVNLISSSAGHYLSRRPYIMGLIKELVASQELTGARIVIERDMGRNIGTTDIVSTSDEDSIYYAQPVKTEAFSRFAKNRYPQQSKKLTIIIVQDAEGNYEIRDTWVGPYCPAFPGAKDESSDSKKYWQTHALVHDAQTIQSKSITRDCPY
ncbi:MAG TPA: hypothetical protein VGF75_03140 [Candidatus Saccharimonadales bacterium]|jgi:hypothetical protein